MGDATEGEGKKLAEAAVHWAQASGDEAKREQLREDLEATGAPDDVIEQVLQQRAPVNDFFVHADNVDTVRAFYALSTQWRVVCAFDRAINQGLEYNSIKHVLWELAIPRRERRAVSAGLRIMESAAVVFLNMKPEDGQ